MTSHFTTHCKNVKTIALIIYYSCFVVIIIGDPSIIVTIWNVVFANKSGKLGWIWMKLGRWG